MINNKSVLAYVPARMNSKGIKNKNIANLGGKPLLAHSIIAAKNSQYVDKVIINTDSEEYAKIAIEYGAEKPFLRPSELATDTSIEIDSLLYMLNWFEKNDKKYDIVIKLQPTSPFRTSEDIDKALEDFISKKATSIISVTKSPVNPDWINELPENGLMKNFLNQGFDRKNRQDLKEKYLLDGSIFLSDWDSIKNEKTWYSEKSFAFIIPEERALDIDNEFELKMARGLIKNE